MRLKEFAILSDKFITKVKAMDLGELEELRKTLVVRQERRRMTYARTRNSADGEAYRKASAELGHVRTQISLRK